MRGILRIAAVDGVVHCIDIDSIRGIDYLDSHTTGMDWVNGEDGYLDAFPIGYLDLITAIANLADEVRSLHR